jgi:hypothetical protein
MLTIANQSVQRNATQHNTTQHNTTQHSTTQHNTTQHNTTQHNTTQHNTTQHNTVEWVRLELTLLPFSASPLACVYVMQYIRFGGRERRLGSGTCIISLGSHGSHHQAIGSTSSSSCSTGQVLVQSKRCEIVLANDGVAIRCIITRSRRSIKVMVPKIGSFRRRDQRRSRSRSRSRSWRSRMRQGRSHRCT